MSKIAPLPLPGQAEKNSTPFSPFSSAGEQRTEVIEERERACEAGDSLPCLYSNNSTEDVPEKLRKEQILALCGILAPYQKRQAATLYANVQRLVNMAPSVGHIGFFTLTTKDNVTDKAEFSRRWDSFNSHFWKNSPHFGHWIGTYEQQRRGAWHLHILVILPYDIRTGINFEELEKRQYRSASPYLRSLWRDLRGACMRYGFGRHELHPIKSNAEGMARYVGKYISKHIGQRDETAKGKRLIASSQGWVKNSVHFAWNTEGSKEWRRKVALFATVVNCPTMEHLYIKLGPNWAYRYLDSIYSIDETVKGLPSLMVEGELIDPRAGEILF